jgi:acetylornithine deacetylase/succinyl-diaminopimelate desuccinylase-like protein
MAAEAPRRRPRRGSLERPVSTRIYRAAWLAVAVPLLVAAFSVGEPDALPEPRLRPFFDQSTAVQFSRELASTYPDRSPGSLGATGAADWVEAQLRQYEFTVERQTFTADVPGSGTEELVNLVAVAPRTGGQGVQSQKAIAILAHRDNLGTSPGAVDNASGTGALLELARALGSASLSHPFILVSTDGGSLGGLGAAHFAEAAPYADSLAAVVNLVAVG